jgi:hypothetical protein
MTSTELAVVEDQQGGHLRAVMDYSRTVASASMLPNNYRNKPADIMLAIGLGQSMGLSPAESLYRISVIAGKPTASAELIAANVRKAGHRLRVSGDETSATATIIRADDPDYEFTVTRDLEWAKRMKLADNDNYKKQPGTMLQWRAITAVARLACPEALYGVAYSPDEMGEVSESRGGGLGAVLAGQVDSDTIKPDEPKPCPVRGCPNTAQACPGHTGNPLNTKSALAVRMFATFNEAGITEREDRLKYVSDVVGREVTSSGEMTEADASAVLDALAADLEGNFSGSAS